MSKTLPNGLLDPEPTRCQARKARRHERCDLRPGHAGAHYRFPERADKYAIADTWTDDEAWLPTLRDLKSMGYDVSRLRPVASGGVPK